MGVSITVCGGIAVAGDHRAVGRGVARDLLALLVLHRGQPLDTEVLIDALWDDPPPATASTIVHGAVARLRRALGADAVLRTEAGYVLDEHVVDVDLWRGLDLVAAGEVAAARELLVEPLLGPCAARPWAEDRLGDVRGAVGAKPVVRADGAALGSARRQPGAGALGVAAPDHSVGRLVGRRRELNALRTGMERSRLVTIVGLGGVGKTRLATEALAEVQGSILRLDLGRGQGRFTDRLATAVGAVPVPGDVATPVVLANLVEGADLLVVDSCELDLDGTADAVTFLLRRWPALRVLATSRTAIGVPGEHIVPLLPFDDPGDPRGDAVELLLDRVRSLGVPFVDGDRERAAAICRSCAGVPLAIELAAAGLLDVPPGPSVAVLAPAVAVRQRIDDAVASLTPQAAGLARRAAVLTSGLTVGIAQQIDRAAGTAAVRELLSTGLLAVEAGPTGRRFHVLDTVRQALGEQVSPDDRRVVARTLAEIGAPSSPAAGAGPDIAALAAALPEVENVNGILPALAADGLHEERLALARAFAVPWSELGYNTFGGAELLSAATACREAGSLDDVGWSEVVAAHTDVLQSFEHVAANLDLVADALPAAITAGRDDLVAALQFALACSFGYRGDMAQGLAALEAARQAAEAGDVEALSLRIRTLLAVAWARTGDRAGARAEIVAVTRRLVELGWYASAARAYLALAQLARWGGDLDQALVDVGEGEEMAHAGLSRVALVWLRHERAEMELERRAAGEASPAALAAIRAAVESTLEVAGAAGQLRIGGLCRVRLGVLDGDPARLADAAAGLLATDVKCCSLAVAHLYRTLPVDHPVRPRLPAMVAALDAQPGGMLVSGVDMAVVAAVAAEAGSPPPDGWRDELGAALTDIATGGR